MPKSTRISSSEEVFWVSIKVLDEDLYISEGELIFVRAQRPNFRRLSNLNSFIEAKAQRKQMKKKEEMMNRRRSDFEVFIVISFLEPGREMLLRLRIVTYEVFQCKSDANKLQAFFEGKHQLSFSCN